MADYTVKLPVAPTDPTNVDAYLDAHGYVRADGSSLLADGLTVIVHVDRDPTADLAAYANSPTQAQTRHANAIAYLKNTYVPKYAAIPVASRSDQDNALLAIVTILKAQLGQ